MKNLYWHFVQKDLVNGIVNEKVESLLGSYGWDKRVLGMKLHYVGNNFTILFMEMGKCHCWDLDHENSILHWLVLVIGPLILFLYSKIYDLYILRMWLSRNLHPTEMLTWHRVINLWYCNFNISISGKLFSWDRDLLRMSVFRVK